MSVEQGTLASVDADLSHVPAWLVATRDEVGDRPVAISC